METKVLLEAVIYFENDFTQIDHMFKVLGFALALSENEEINDVDRTVIALSAILHDIGIPEAKKRFHSSDGRYQEMLGPDIARRILESCGVGESIRDRVCFIVAHHHSYDQVDGLDFRILVEADFLVNIHEGYVEEREAPAVYDRHIKTDIGKKLFKKLYLSQ
jgi:hypothetical protein